jgi:hypothetical protein
VIQGYVAAHGIREEYRKGKGWGKRPKPLPPGLQKKVERGGSLPPGWQAKLRRGEVMPLNVYERCDRLPPDLVRQLPPPPRGTVLVVISGKVVRLIEATREILDVFEVQY